MSRDPIALVIPDLSAFAKSLRSELRDPPSHSEMLGLIARAAGYRNYQHLKARLEETPQEAPDDRAVTRAARYFDDMGRFAEWPAKTSVQALCLWVIWAQMPAGSEMTEREVSALIHGLCSFRDAAQIRRAMIEHRMLTRTTDGRVYQRIEQRPPSEARALITRILKP